MASRSLPVKFDFADEPAVAVMVLCINNCGGVENDKFNEAVMDLVKMVRKNLPMQKLYEFAA